MSKERTVTQKYMECDGCKYTMGGDPFITVSVPSPEGDEAEGWPEPAPLPDDYWESAQ